MVLSLETFPPENPHRRGDSQDVGKVSGIGVAVNGQTREERDECVIGKACEEAIR
jgi:hypothetical protein